ncbi:MAG TPA: hypothetical protein VFO06_07125 [Gemmatimonadales bacterium]|nr:hypothetical protein [Gemmatimonadales bacterium]
MRSSQILGLLLILAGVVLLWLRPAYTTKKNVLEIGDVKASVDEEQRIPKWVGGVAIGAGLVLIVGAARRQG